MAYELVFRLAMLTGLLLVLPFAFYYRIRSNATKEKLDRMQEGLPILIGIRLFALVSFVGLFAFLINPEWMRWSHADLPIWLRSLGIIIGIFGGVLWIVTFHYLGKNLTDTVVVRKEATLVTIGPYAYVRHPFYVAFGLLVVANGLAAANWFIFVTALAAFCCIVLRTPKEEARLIERFGDAYRTYMAKTGAFFPKF